MKKKLIIYNTIINTTYEDSTDEMISLEQLSITAKSKEIIPMLFRYRKVILELADFQSISRPFIIACCCRCLTLGECTWIDKKGYKVNINLFKIMGLLFEFLRDLIKFPQFIREVEHDISYLSKQEIECFSRRSGQPLYIKCDVPGGYLAGGSIGHTAGVVNNLEKVTGEKPIFISTDSIPTISEDIEKHILNGSVKYRNILDASSLAFDDLAFKKISKICEEQKILFLYQRSALNSYSGIKAAISYSIPFVLEYNGSEVWITNKWQGRRLKFQNISEKIEKLNFEKATLITCVSRALKEQLIEYGTNPDKIIVTPNGVNPDMYSPDIDGSIKRRVLRIRNEETVIGFIGTFGVWHGAEILVEAFAKLIEENTKLKKNCKLLLIGDGIRMPEVRKMIERYNIGSNCILTRTVPQNEGPQYLAACDILVSPTVPNIDGTPFFGSPTKLFEYMAMGKAIISSDMDQMSEIFEHNRTALLCKPGDYNELKIAMNELIVNPNLRIKLGKEAREEVCKKYTWEIHTRRILEALNNVSSSKCEGN